MEKYEAVQAALEFLGYIEGEIDGDAITVIPSLGKDGESLDGYIVKLPTSEVVFVTIDFECSMLYR